MQLGQFDNSFANAELLSGHLNEDNSTQYTGLLEKVDQLELTVQNLQNMGQDYIDNPRNAPTESEIDDLYDTYVQTALGYISGLIEFESGIVMVPLSKVQAHLDDFLLHNRSLVRELEDFSISAGNIEKLVEGFNQTVWSNIVEEAEQARGYLSATGLLKTDLTEAMESGDIKDRMGDIDVFFSALRSRGRDLKDSWQQLEGAWGGVWSSMLQGGTFDQFYQRLSNYYRGYMRGKERGNDNWERQAIVLLEMIYLQEPSLVEDAERDIQPYQLNADFSDMDVDQTLAENDAEFQDRLTNTDIAELLGDVDRDFKKALYDFQDEIEVVKKEKEMDVSFYV